MIKVLGKREVKTEVWADFPPKNCIIFTFLTLQGGFDPQTPSPLRTAMCQPIKFSFSPISLKFCLIFCMIFFLMNFLKWRLKVERGMSEQNWWAETREEGFYQRQIAKQNFFKKEIFFTKALLS